MAKVLIVEDDPQIRAIVKDWLSADGYIVETADTGREGFDLLKIYNYDMLILDWMLPDVSGPELCRVYRSKGGSLPVLILTAKGEINDKVVGFDAGADDYLTKPFHPKELTARVQALLRRPTSIQQEFVKIGRIIMSRSARIVRKDDHLVELLPKEFALLEFLMSNPNQVFSMESLLNRVWPADSEASPETVRVHITRLRGKLDTEGEPSIIRTIHRVGYVLDAPTNKQDENGIQHH